jgi:hypothetical protein
VAVTAGPDLLVEARTATGLPFVTVLCERGIRTFTASPPSGRA